MAKERMVTRTVTITRAQYMSVQLSMSTVSTHMVEIAGNLSTEEALTYARKVLERSEPDRRYVTCLSVEHYEVLYGMPESVFISMAKVMPARTKTE